MTVTVIFVKKALSKEKLRTQVLLGLEADLPRKIQLVSGWQPSIAKLAEEEKGARPI